MISRRLFLASAGILILSDRAGATQSGKVWRIGYLSANLEKEGAPYLQALIEGLRTLGHIEGQDVLIERRFAEGRFEALPALAEELVQLKVDVILAPTTPAARAAHAATRSIPIVFVVASDPVGSGLVASLPHPGGNVTGMTDMGLDLAAKRLELLKQLVPHLKHVAVLGHPADTLWEPVWRETEVAARRLRIDAIPVLITAPAQLEPAFAKLNGRVEGVVVAPQHFFSVHRRKIIELASRERLPAVYEFRGFPDAGGLMSYGVDNLALFRKAARHVDRILKGARPADLPVEQPTEYELVVNLKTAKALGLTIPESILVRANEVIR